MRLIEYHSCDWRLTLKVAIHRVQYRIGLQDAKQLHLTVVVNSSMKQLKKKLQFPTNE